MFERFTDKARRVVVLAQENARLLNHNYIGTEHILLGLAWVNQESIAKTVLNEFDLGYELLKERVEKVFPPTQPAAKGHIPFTQDAKKLLEQSSKQGRNLGVNYIGPEHILLAMLLPDLNTSFRKVVGQDIVFGDMRMMLINLATTKEGATPTLPSEKVVTITVEAELITTILRLSTALKEFIDAHIEYEPAGFQPLLRELTQSQDGSFSLTVRELWFALAWYERDIKVLVRQDHPFNMLFNQIRAVIFTTED